MEVDASVAGVRLLVGEAKARYVGRLEPGGLETRQYGAMMEELLSLTLMSSRLREISILADVLWHGAMKVVLKEEMLLVVCAAKIRLRKRSEVMARGRKIYARSVRCINACCACVRCAS